MHWGLIQDVVHRDCDVALRAFVIIYDVIMYYNFMNEYAMHPGLSEDWMLTGLMHESTIGSQNEAPQARHVRSS